MPEAALESLTISAPATSANLGPGFDCLAVALDLGNAVVITRRPGPLEVRVTGEGAGEVAEDASNLVCRALAAGLGSLDGLHVECRNRIPLGRGLGSSAAAICSGLVAANAIGQLRWAPADLLARAAEIEGHADNVAACLTGGLVAVAPGPVARPVPVPEGLVFLAVIPEGRTSTAASRRALPEAVPLGDVAATLANGIGLVLALADGRLEDLPELLHDRLHEPYRAPMAPAFEAVGTVVDGDGCLGATISGSGPSVLLWCRAEAAGSVAAAAERALRVAGVTARVRPSKASAAGVRARWTGGADLRLARAVG
ncbi:homoserine kinase [Miltoncostaea marina]|uniref:homoserine kinase n=1 Tax=Miltoncostaea marina TaxID=2843215 RepID=UPI001C3D8367|nr:homoserine kinase [Miltoncostaea marina]